MEPHKKAQSSAASLQGLCTSNPLTEHLCFGISEASFLKYTFLRLIRWVGLSYKRQKQQQIIMKTNPVPLHFRLAP